MVLEIGGLAESVTVRGETPLVDTTSKEVGGHISADEFVNTPSFNRSFSGFLGMVPGIVSTVSTSTFGGDTISAGGQGARNVNYTMDGSDNNDGLTGGGTSSQARVPIEAVQEFKVLTSQFDAEYGGTSGAIVNAVSKQGTNAFHGSGFAFFQDHHLSAQNYFGKTNNLPEAPTHAAAIWWDHRRPDRPRQGALLLQRRAHHHGQRRGDQHPVASRAEPHGLSDHAQLEHVHPLRPSDRCRQHLGRSLAA